MKKLMMAAAIAAMTAGAYADLCDDDPDVVVADKCEVYNFKMSVKTLVPAKIKCSSDEIAVYFKKGTRKFEGILWDCVATCDDTAPASNFIAWEPKAKQAVTTELSWSGEYWTADALEFSTLDRFGKKANDVEAYADATFTIGEFHLAGFGSYDAKNERIKSISGNVVGMITPATYDVTEKAESKCDDDTVNTNVGKVLALCDEFDDWCCTGDEADQVVASGTWSIKYNKTLSKGKKRLSQIVPSYAQAAE